MQGFGEITQILAFQVRKDLPEGIFITVVIGIQTDKQKNHKVAINSKGLACSRPISSGLYCNHHLLVSIFFALLGEKITSY